jgi:thiamine-phosphate pyrophosphorylase
MFFSFEKMLLTQKGFDDTPLYLQFINSLCQSSQITAVLMREKHLSRDEKIAFGRLLIDVLSPYSIPFLVNDDIDLALELNADGVHLGQSDGCPMDARKRLGDNKYIGLTVDSFEDIERANLLQLDYVGVGAIFKTPNKPDVKTIWGLDGLKEAIQLSRHPVIAIGGIEAVHLPIIEAMGSGGIAAIGMYDALRYIK